MAEATNHKHSSRIQNNIFTGRNTPNDYAFKTNHGIAPPFHLDCFQCCWTFLVDDRNYTHLREGDKEIVKYGDNDPTVRGLVVSCDNHDGFVKTGKDCSYPGYPYYWQRPVKNSTSYELYTQERKPTAVLGKHMLLTARPESIPLDVKGDTLQMAQLNGCYFSYADAAALLELYLQKKYRSSLRGCCCWKPEPTSIKNKLFEIPDLYALSLSR